MTQADRIRQFAVDHYILPARAQGRVEITIRAGDVHRAMGLTNHYPAVCNAIGYQKFFEMARVTLIDRDGPANGGNVYFKFSLNRAPREMRRTDLPLFPETKPIKAQPERGVDLRNAVFLVSCVKSKRPHPAPARALYTSAWFMGARDLVESSGAPWFVLSSLYGLVAPETVIAPYDYTLNAVGVAKRKAWAVEVLDRLLPLLGGRRRVVILAGMRYREFIVQPLLRHGIAVELPMEGLRRGEQLAWLAAQR
jgi:hypothetical protein